MTPTIASTAPRALDIGCQAADLSIPELVGQVYDGAPASERGRLLEPLLRPLGLLSLVAVAGGVFARLRLNPEWPSPTMLLDDLAAVRGRDVIALVEHVQQVSVEAVDSLAQLLAASPVLASSAAAALLVAVLMQHRSPATRPAGDFASEGRTG